MGSFVTPPDIAAEFDALNRRISALERSRPIAVGSGPPPAGLVDGAMYGDKPGLFLYVVLGGVPRKVAVS